jgi:Immunoglobulin I-set domain
VAPKIDRRSLKNVSVREGEAFVIDVKIIGEPPPEVTWTIGVKPIQLSHSRRVDDVPYNSKYYNDKPERKDTATYTITAVNKYGQDSADVEVAVICKLHLGETIFSTRPDFLFAPVVCLN